ncbi:acyl-CoA thioester hydrolase [Melghirimyces profundicolus]|uniref:Acyl-CoA thioester hydrolase n=1 Tax=Melghirimyces profundicolus TaxID=1242148 RepID=A0A2T6C8A0_9BACL|nr:thioesterase family protein [Melghirimyces profundicolus]PTX64544.1 acyl-CoA thioester hydrolase [Melghirimyces profundicolus]
MVESEIKVRFCETDALGHVNNTSYFIYLEQARVEFFENLGSSMAMSRWPFILGHIQCDFLQQAYFNQKLTIRTGVAGIGNKSFRLRQDILDAINGVPVGRSESVMVYFDFREQQSVPIPGEWVKKLEEYRVEPVANR